MANFDTKTMYNFEKYFELQKSGAVNMASAEARERLGITEDEHRFIMKNYSSILEEYNGLKVVDDVIADAKARADGVQSKDKNLAKDMPSKTAE